MKVIFLFIKDLRILWRDPKTVLLILIGPLIMMVVIGLVFSVSAQPGTDQLTAIKVGVCDNDHSTLSANFTDFINQTFTTTTGDTDFHGPGGSCETQLHQELREGGLMAVMIIPEGFEAGIERGETEELHIIVNNGNPQISVIMTSVFDGFVGRMSKEMSSEFVSATWIKLAEMRDNLVDLNAQLSGSKGKFSSLRDQMGLISDDLGSMDVATMKSYLYRARSSLETSKAKTSEYQTEVNFFIGQIDEMDAELDDAGVTLEDADDELVQTRSDLVRTRNNLQQTYDDGECDEASNPPYTGDPQVDEYITRWVILCQDVDIAIDDIDSLIIDVDNHRATITELQIDISEAKDTLGDIRAELVDLERDLGDTSDVHEMESNFDYMLASMENLERTKANSTKTLGEAEKLLSVTLSDIDSLEKSSGSAVDVLTSLVDRPPSSVVTPINLNMEFLFTDSFRNIDAFFPAVLSIVVMFVSVLFAAVSVIKEKKMGTMTRLRMAPVSIFWFVVGKISITLLIVSLQIILLFAVSFALFQVEMNWVMVPVAFIVACALAVTSAAAGMIIASIARTENTAILASLVICIPLMFLSGVFFPWELMLPEIRTASFVSPLTNAVNVLNSLLIYSKMGIDLKNVLLSSGYLVFWSVASLLISTLLLKKQ